ncbi:MAG: PilZ domain-containing protein [Rhodospirillales bacterium]|nr:PilZ domain-containing protein [Rhodospirillales bacterium]
MTSLSSGFSVRTQGAKPHQRRRDTRIESPIIRIRIEGQSYRTVNWSLGGVLIAAYDGSLREGNEFTVTGIGLEHGGLVAVMVPTRAVRVRDGFLAACFTELDGRAYDVLEALLMKRPGRIQALVAAAA